MPLPADVRRATAYVTALGLYELHLNGRRLEDRILAPEWTSYRKRVQVQTYDITQMLHKGDNVIGVQVGEGWYAGRLMAMPRFPYGSFPRFLCQLEIELADGSTQTIVTDETWKSTHRPARSCPRVSTMVRSMMPAGNRTTGTCPGFADAEWQPVTIFDLGPERLVWQPNEPIRGIPELRPDKQPRLGTIPLVYERFKLVKELQPVEMTEPAPRNLRVRPRSEYGRLVSDQGARTPKVSRSQSGMPRCSTTTERFTPPTCAGRRRVDRYIPRRTGTIVLRSRTSPITASASSS